MPFANTLKFPLILCFFWLVSSATAAPQARPLPAPAPVGLVQFTFSGNVAQVPLEVSDHLALVPVRVNGARPSWFLLDTSQPTSSLDDVRAVALGLLPPGSANSSSKALPNAALEFPSLKISIPTLALGSFGDLSSRVGRAVQGILGADVLSHFVVVIRYDRQTLQLYDPKSFQYKGAGVKLKTQILGGTPAVAAKLSIRHRGTLQGLFSIATGQAEAMKFTPSFAASHRFSTLDQKMILFSPINSPGDFDDHLGRVESLQLGKISLEDPVAIFPGASEHTSTSGSPSVAGAIGGEILDRFTVILDYPDQSVIFEPNPHFNDLFVADMSGLVLVATPPDYRAFGIDRVIEKSPAALAGIAVGDMLEKIDGNPASDYSLGDLRALLRQDGTEHTLTVLRNGQHLQFTLKLKPLV